MTKIDITIRIRFNMQNTRSHILRTTGNISGVLDERPRNAYENQAGPHIRKHILLLESLTSVQVKKRAMLLAGAAEHHTGRVGTEAHVWRW